ncbi:MAG: hypothetical protein SFX19_10030 [Alphaproteobacteria bacterium]|nr:hypothetical protein [Alphaproteobacteria bacterium]
MDRKTSLNYSAALFLIAALTGCSYGLQRESISDAEIKKTGIILHKNYQKLYQCLDEKGIKAGQVDLCCQVTSQLYTTQNRGEFRVTNPSGYYFVLFDLKATAPKQTSLDIYAVGSIGRTYVSNWESTLKQCEAESN